MPGTRTVPTIDGSFQYKKLSITMYDYTGEQRTESYLINSAATDAQVEAIVAAMQAVTNGTIWRVQVGEVYNSVGDSSNALEEVWEDIQTNVVILIKDAMTNGQDWFIPAPINALFLEGTEELNPGNAALATLLTAILAVKTGFSVVSGRFTQRRQVGTKVNI